MIVKLTEPKDVGELALIQSLLDVNNIPFVVHHEHVGSLYPGLPSLGCRVMVDELYAPLAEMLLSRLSLQIREVPSSS